MIVRTLDLKEIHYRTDYHVEAFQDKLDHLVVRRTTPDNPFDNKPHAGVRYWFILEGAANVTVGEESSEVTPGDLVYVPEWIASRLETDTECQWICFG